MKKLFFLLTAVSMILCLVSCTPEPYAGAPIAPAAAGDSEPWPADTFFAAAPHIAETVKSVSVNEDGTTYSIKVTDISYDDFVSWANAMQDAGVKPVGSGAYGLDGMPEDGLASFNGETRQFTVLSTWTDDASSHRSSDTDLSVSFIKKK